MDIDKMIQCIDQYLSENKLENIGVQKALEILKSEQLYERGEIPFRSLLREGKISHAFQLGGKGSHWLIPRSDSGKALLQSVTQKQTAPAVAVKPKPTDASKTRVSPKTADVSKTSVYPKPPLVPKSTHAPVSTLELAREKYQPAPVKYLLLAEAPPASLESFFYFEDVQTKDELFLAVLEAIQGKECKADFLAKGRDKAMKEFFLKRLHAQGFYLLDCLQEPMSEGLNKEKRVRCLYDQIPSLLKRVKAVINTNTKIILIKTSVFDAAYSGLTTEFPGQVIRSRIPFSATGGQRKFQQKFKDALKKADYKFRGK